MNFYQLPSNVSFLASAGHCMTICFVDWNSDTSGAVKFLAEPPQEARQPRLDPWLDLEKWKLGVKVVKLPSVCHPCLLKSTMTALYGLFSKLWWSQWVTQLMQKMCFLFEFQSLYPWKARRYVCFVGRNSDTSGAEVTLLLPLVFRKKLGLQTLQQNEHAYRYKAAAQYPTVMAIRVVEFSNGGYKIRKVFP